MSKTLKLSCDFCGTPTNFQEKGHDYCIDCYVKIRNSAHTHKDLEALPVRPSPINPMPLTPPGIAIPAFQPPYRVIC